MNRANPRAGIPKCPCPVIVAINPNTDRTNGITTRTARAIELGLELTKTHNTSAIRVIASSVTKI